MEADSYYCIGHGHNYCQDYAKAEVFNENDAAAVLCDGCSMSKDSDIGARLLTTFVFNKFKMGMHKWDLYDRSPIEYEIITTIRGLDLPVEVLDSTILFSYFEKYKKEIFTGIIGDGVIVEKTKDFTFVYQFEQPQSMPRYLSYDFDEERKKKYNEIVKEYLYIKSVYSKENNKNNFIKIGNTTTNDVLNQIMTSELTKEIYLFSDGIMSFSGIDFLEVIKECTNFKSTKGEFIKRRTKSFLKSMEKQGITHFDDFSMAGIIL